MNCAKCEKESPSVVAKGDLCRECMSDKDVCVLREKVLSLKSALDYYSDKRLYGPKDGVGYTVPAEILKDAGLKARSELKKG